MILLDMKNSKTASSPLGLATSKEKPLLSFSDLLKSAGDKKEGKVVQNGSLVLALDAQERSVKTPKTVIKSDSPISLLKLDEKVLKGSEAELLELNPNLISALSSADIKTLISDAKNYLKEKIQSSDGYKNAEIKELPKTLSGLIEVAKKMGIDVSKISLEELKQSSLVQPQSSDLQESGRFLKTTDKPEQLQKESMQDENALAQKDIPTEKAQNTKQEQLLQRQDTTIKETPLFKAQSEHVATEQIVQAKTNNLAKSEQKHTKERNDEALRLLLSDDSASSNISISQNISESALKVVHSASAQEGIKTLEQLLQGGESSLGEQNQTASKIEAFGVHKSDSLEVKMNEAKQMIRYLSDDIKNAIDDYKSPFTRIKVQLNPQHLGEVDLTVVQRGKNLHVNITSNNSAINTLAMNVNELKVQLNNNGINNATFHFNESSQQSFADGQNSSQQRQNEQRRAHEEYNYFENEEANEEILSSLEIVVPQYI